MENKDPYILNKDVIFPAITQQYYPGNSKFIYLSNPDVVEQRDSVASFSCDGKFLHFSIVYENNDFFDYESGRANPKKDLHKQGNSIAFYFQPVGKTNFYRFEYAASDTKTLHLYTKTPNGRYKSRKIKNPWKACQETVETVDIWCVRFEIPLSSCGLSDKITGSRFLIVRYRYSESSADPIVTNSMSLPANQLLDPVKWNIVSSEQDEESSAGILNKTFELKKQQCQQEILERTDNQESVAKNYVELLNDLYAECNKTDYDETFRRLERFVNLPEFWRDDQKLGSLCYALYGVRESKAYEIFSIIHLVMVGATLLAEKELQERILKKNQHEYNRLQSHKNTHPKKKVTIDPSLLPCFSVIFKYEYKGTHWGHYKPQKYIFEHCKRKWKIKFSTFRKKYDQWLDAKNKFPEDIPKPSRCPYGYECKKLESKL
ncbi:MAG: hypothetical protein PHV82_04640 [Victivallaceae bacterium]|nr:hypothetical protein [Victivallaceae bacterium]